MARETECKLPYPSASAARDALESVGAEPVRPREFEDNRLYDTAGGTLAREGVLLRLRTAGGRARLTVKRAAGGGDTHHKVREEFETSVGDPDETDRLLRALGYEIWFRYQKFRSTHALPGVEVCLDETALGCFVELEGDPAAIDRWASAHGFTPDRYVTASYLALQRAAHPDEERLPDLLIPADGVR